MTAFATLPSGELRVASPDSAEAAPGGLSASTLPLRASSVARRGRLVRRVSSSPGRTPGNSSERVQAMRVPAPGSSTVVNAKSSERTPNSRVSTRTGTSTSPPGAPRAEPVIRTWVAVAVISACR